MSISVPRFRSGTLRTLVVCAGTLAFLACSVPSDPDAQRGSLVVTINGLPGGASANVTVSGPAGFARQLTSTTTLTGLAAGTYSINAADVTHGGSSYSASSRDASVTVTAGASTYAPNVTYAVASGAMTLNISGLPQGVGAAVNITGPANYSIAITESTVLEQLTPGQYTISASNVMSGALFQPAPAVQHVFVIASVEAVVTNIFYASAGTSLTVQVNGLPATVPATVKVTSPNGSTSTFTSTQVISGIPAGTYTISATPTTASCTTYSPAPSIQAVTVVNEQATTATVTYTAPPGGVNLCIDGAYITQAIQKWDNSVPLVAGRNAVLRVFVLASGANSALPSVRARFYNGTTLTNTIIIPPPLPSVPLVTDEAAVGSSWNATLAGQLLQPGMSMLLDVDPANTVVEGNEGDNMLPANGTPAALDVRTVAPLNVRLVPVIQAVRGDTARIDESSKTAFINPMLKMFPVVTISSDVHAPYTYSGAELASGGGNWNALLSEINALRITEASGRSYYGVVRVGYPSGVAGLGYIGAPAAIGWDHPISGPEVMAHELGHNFGRLHAPCGNPAGPDAQYPYFGAVLGAFGYDIFTNAVKVSALRDLMSYCDPAWISDYTYKAILNFRASNPGSPNVTSSATTSSRGMLIWGRIDRGRVILEPAIEVDAPAMLPARGGPHRLEAFGPRGEALFSLAFAGEHVADSPDPNDEHFAFVVPMSRFRGIDLDRLRLSALGRQVEQRGSGGGAIASAVRTNRGVRVTWNAALASMALIRDARTGEILSFARSGAADLPARDDDLEVTLSDGVRSIRSRLRPR